MPEETTSKECLPAEVFPLDRMRRAILDGGPIKGPDVNRIARDCLIVAGAMVEEAVTNARQNNRQEMDELRKSFEKEAASTKLLYAGEIDELKGRLDNAVNEGGKAIANNEKLICEVEELKASVALVAAERDRAETDVKTLTDQVRELTENNMDMGTAFHSAQDELKRAEEIYTGAIEGMKTDLETAQAGWKEATEELKDARILINRGLQEAANLNGVIANTNRHMVNLEGRLKSEGSSRRALCETIETLANVIRNS